MGSWNYYIKLKTDELTLNHMILEYKQNKTFQDVFYFGVQDDCSDGYNAEFVAIVDNFLPTNHLIYNFLSNYSSCNLHIKTNGIECIYDFTQKSDFIKFMYDVWENKIDFVYNQLGVIIVKYKKYHRIRSKLYKNCYVSIPRRQGTVSVKKETGDGSGQTGDGGVS